jgi:3-oxoacyl-[acyl-carrier protein] reductase
MKIDFTNQVVLITGATRGIGKQIADDLAELGAELILTGTSPEQIEALNMEAQCSGNVLKKYFVVDLTDESSTESFLSELKKCDKIDVCVNNAGINRINFINETLLEDFRDVMAVNIEAPFLITREVSKIMKRNKYGRIVNISSIWGVISKAKRSVYSMSKFALRGLTVCASIELAPYNILVNSVSPGFVLTELTKNILSEQEMVELAVQVPVRRFATPEEISKTVLFLASSLNTYITGQNIIVDGGYTNV